MFRDDNQRMKCTSYNSVFNLKQSSHLYFLYLLRPVFAVLETQVEEFDKQKREVVLTEFIKAQKLQEANLVIEDLGQNPQNPEKELYESYFYT